MNFPLRTFLATSCGQLLIVLEWKVCPVSLEAALNWALPLFQMIFHPLASGSTPQACLCALVLNSVLVTGAIFWLLSTKGSTRQE